MALARNLQTISKETIIDLTEDKEDVLRKIVSPEHPENPYEVLGEWNFNPPRVVPETEIGTPVQEFFRGATIFITGATGFLGVTLIEKLLRSCPHIKHIYMLVRNKRNESSEKRYEQYFHNDMFKRLKYEAPNFQEKVSMISGHVDKPNFALSDEDKQKIIDEVDIIYHSAATVRFDEKLGRAIKINTCGTREAVRLAKNVKNLKVIMYVSTAYSFCTRLEIEEKVYPLSENQYVDIIKNVETSSEEEIQKLEAKLMQSWPNTYVLSKAMAENVVMKEGKGLPVGIFRPSIVTSTYNEPIRGWTNNLYGPTGMILAYVCGIFHVNYGNMNTEFVDTVPVDMVINSLICATRETALHHQNSSSETDRAVPVYAYANASRNTLTYKQLHEISKNKVAKHWPCMNTVWYPTNISVDNYFIFKLLSLLLHRIPGYILDLLAVMTGREAVLTNIYKQIDSMEDKIEYFRRRKWLFRVENTKKLWKNLSAEDKELFPFEIEKINWERYVHYFILGGRVYMLKDDIKTLPSARKKFKRLCIVHKFCKCLFFISLLVAFVFLANFLYREFVSFYNVQ